MFAILALILFTFFWGFIGSTSAFGAVNETEKPTQKAINTDSKHSPVSKSNPAETALKQGDGNLLLKNADIYTFDRGLLKGYDLLVKNGKIFEIAKNIPANDRIMTINLDGKSLIPGIIDSHTHIGLSGGSNEMGEKDAAEIIMELMMNPDDDRIYYCLTGGVTMVCALHGSADPIGGQNLVFKLKWGKSPEEMIDRRAVRTLKFALGENVRDRDNGYPATRMGVSSVIDNDYAEALKYRKSWKSFQEKWSKGNPKDREKMVAPKKNFKWEALLDTIDGKMVARCHTYRASEALDFIRLSKKYGFKIGAFEHFHQAYRVADELKAENIPVSMFCDVFNYKVEASEFSPLALKLLYEKGVMISLNSDSFEIMRRFNMEAGKLRRYTGMSDMEALKTITLNSAKVLGMDRFTGSIEVGKEADLAVFDGHPLSSMSKCILTIIDGQIYFDRSKDPNMGEPK